MWFGKPEGLNDPFDCLVPLRFSAVTLDECNRLLRSKEGTAWASVVANIRLVDKNGNPTEALRSAIEKAGRDSMQQSTRENYSSRGVSCFSEHPDDTLLWSHYGGGHRGICLEFDTSSPLLTGKLHKVSYCDDIPEINIVDELIGERSRILDTLLTKASCWSYEREWRAIHQKANTVYGYGVEALTGVYLGARLTDEERDVIGHLLHGSPSQLYRVDREEESFRLKVTPVTYVPFRYSQ